MPAHILVVEDEPGILALLTVNLLRAGHLAVGVADAESALVSLDTLMPDLVLIDWVLPGMSGLELTRRLKSESRTKGVSIILLTARTAERDVVAALDAGADDYITKPFSPRELMARIAAVLRRRVPQVLGGIVELGPLRLDPASGRLAVAGQEFDVGATELRLLHFMMTRPNQVHSRATLLAQAMGGDPGGPERVVDLPVRRLRALLAKAGLGRVIQAVRGNGYVIMTAQMQVTRMPVSLHGTVI